jgi:hypothetical protein
MWTEKTIENKVFSDDRKITIQEIEQLKADGWKVNIFKDNKYDYRDDIFYMDGFVDDIVYLEPVRK